MKDITIIFKQGELSSATHLTEDFLEFASREHKGVVFERLIRKLKKERFTISCCCSHHCHHC